EYTRMEQHVYICTYPTLFRSGNDVVEHDSLWSQVVPVAVFAGIVDEVVRLCILLLEVVWVLGRLVSEDLRCPPRDQRVEAASPRSEEHTSELQSRVVIVCLFL